MSLEKELSKEIRLTKLRRAILTTVGAAGVISIAVMAPNVLSLVGKVQKRQREKLRSAITRLKTKGLVEIGANGVRLTKKGERYLRRMSLATIRPRKWDRKWRIVIFDIPEDRRRHREILRQKLVEIGFFRLQNSVWVFPYDCEELLALLKIDYHLGKEVLYIIADKIELSSRIQEQFGL